MGPQGPKGEPGPKVRPCCRRACFGWIMGCLYWWDVVFHSSQRSYSICYRHRGGKAPLSSGWIGLWARIKTLCCVLGVAKVCSHFSRRSFARGPAVAWEPPLEPETPPEVKGRLLEERQGDTLLMRLTVPCCICKSATGASFRSHNSARECVSVIFKGCEVSLWGEFVGRYHEGSAVALVLTCEMKRTKGLIKSF